MGLGYSSPASLLREIARATEENVYRPNQLDYFFPGGTQILTRQVEIPDDAFWEGDIIELELHRNHHENEEGIALGGAWQTIQAPVGECYVNMKSLDNGNQLYVHGCIVNAQGNHVQSIDAHVGAGTFPVRNPRFIKKSF